MPKSTTVIERGNAAEQRQTGQPLQPHAKLPKPDPFPTVKRFGIPQAGTVPGTGEQSVTSGATCLAYRRLLKVVIITTFPDPHKVPVYYRIAETPDVKLHVLFGCRHAPGHVAAASPLDFDHTFLRERPHVIKGRPVFNSIDVVTRLRRLAPDVIMTDGFHPTHLYAFAYAAINGIPHVTMTEGTDLSDSTPNPLHNALRRFVYTRSQGYVATGQAGRRLYEQHGVTQEDCFIVPPAIDNARLTAASAAHSKEFDFLVSGPIERIKNPLFALEVAVNVAHRLGRRIRILYTGSGPLEEQLRHAAASYTDQVDTVFSGFLTPDRLAPLYQSARVLLFPAHLDRWDIAINEACAAGLPILASPNSGVVGELVINEENGYVRELEVDAWGECAAKLLEHPATYERFSVRSRSLVSQFTFEKAATSLIAACRHAMSSRNKARGSNGRRPRVVVVERQLLHYRVAVYQRLRALLDKEGIDLQLLIGEGTPDEKKKKDEVVLDWTIKIPTTYFLGNRICWQPFGAYARDADMVIVMHENKLIYNLWLMSFGRPRRLAFWGHGRNMQSGNPNGWKERFKRWTVNKVDWWFAYTDSSAELVIDAGFPRARTSVVDNAVDTRELSRMCNSVTAADRQRMRMEMGLGNGRVGIYVGSLYKEKRLDFLLQAAKRIQAQIPDFQLLVVGAGPDQNLIEEAARDHAWIHYLGPLQGQHKANMLALADVMLNPGLVGLGILDSFVSGSPMFTTDCGLHSPEISYMVSGQNGMMTDDDLITYADTVVDVLNDREKLDKLKAGALATASRYTIENMANRLRNGILACLATV